jgi:hypothetical protein
MNIYITCLCVVVITVLITDIFCFWETFSSELIYYISKGKIKRSIHFKLFECSLCQSHWINLIVLLCMGKFTIVNYLYILLLSFSTNIIQNIILLVENTILTLINKLNNIIND